MYGGHVLIGATRAHGIATVRRLAMCGEPMVLGDQSRADIERLSAEVDGRAYPMDATHYEQVEWIVDHARKAFGKVAGVVRFLEPVPSRPTHLVAPEAVRRAMHLNVTSSFFVIRAATRAMMHAGGGAIVLVADSADADAPNDVHAAASAAVRVLVASAADSYRRYAIRLTLLEPGVGSGDGMSVHRTETADDVARSVCMALGAAPSGRPRIHSAKIADAENFGGVIS